MLRLLPPALLLAVSPQRDHPVTYLASVSLPLKGDERVSSFSFETWGVEFKSVCRIPPGWRIKAGSSATPDGTLEGEGSHGATWINHQSMRDLTGLVLITLNGPMRRYPVRDVKGDVIIPSTFSGHATIETPDSQREMRIGTLNIKLHRASRCP